MNRYTTKCTRLGSNYGCRIFFDGEVILEGRAPSKALIGPTFRDLFRTLDKFPGLLLPADEFTSAVRHRKNTKRQVDPNRIETQVKHIWHK